MSEWQPIETAPRTTAYGQSDIRILATDGETVSGTYWDHSSKEWRNESEPEDYGYPGSGGIAGHASWRPTKWMHFPDPRTPTGI